MPKISEYPHASVANPDDIILGDQSDVTKTFAVSLIRYSPFAVDAFAATVDLDIGESNRHLITLTGNATLAVFGDGLGEAFLVMLKQDGTGGRTVTWWSGIKWQGATVPTLTGAANAIDVGTFIKVSTGNYLGWFSPNFG